MINGNKINRQDFADAIVLTFILLKFNLDAFLLVASPIITTMTDKNWGAGGHEFFQKWLLYHWTTGNLPHAYSNICHVSIV